MTSPDTQGQQAPAHTSKTGIWSLSVWIIFSCVSSRMFSTFVDLMAIREGFLKNGSNSTSTHTHIHTHIHIYAHTNAPLMSLLQGCKVVLTLRQAPLCRVQLAAGVSDTKCIQNLGS
jgi:hypothetical protein